MISTLISPEINMTYQFELAEIRDTLEVFTIEDHSIDKPVLSYTTVSYTWGDDRTKTPIILDSVVEADVQLMRLNAWKRFKPFSHNLGFVLIKYASIRRIPQSKVSKLDSWIGFIRGMRYMLYARV